MEDFTEPFVGMKFSSPDEAYDFYKRYSCKAGFGITRRTSHNFYGFKYDMTLCCNKNRSPASEVCEEGYRSRFRGNIGTGCKARIVVRDRMLSGNWCVEEVELQHNHELRPDCVRLMRCHRTLPLFVKKQLEVNECVGLAQSKSISAVFTQAGGVTECKFTDRDMRNYVAEVRRLKLKGGDAASLIRYFRKQQNLCPNFWSTYDVDDEGRLTNVFWADGRSRSAFKYFGDVVTFDSTYLTNRYRMPFAVFVGVNHHGQSILLGCALLANEFKETYEWVFKAFIECMNGAPKAIITDQCGSICRAVREVFSETRHRLCLWHIMKKLPEKLIRVDRRDEVMAAVSKAVYESKSVNEFEQLWTDITSKFELGESVSWFNEMFDKRASWVPVFVKPFFWAGMSTTQRSESMNAFFDGYVNSRTSLKIFVEKYDVALHSKWEKEKQEDFRCLNQRPRLVSSFGFERQFCQAYTLRMFYIFQKEVKHLMSLNSTLLFEEGNIKVYRVSDFPANDHYDVNFLVDSQEFRCECMSFEFRGIVCRHGLCVYRSEGIDCIPDKYIVSRWRKDFVRNHVNEIVSFPQSHRDIDRYDALYCRVNGFILNLVEIGSRDNSIGEKLISGLAKLSTELLGSSGLNNSSISQDGVSIDVNSSESVDDATRDPIVIRSKGRPRNRRIKSAAESKGLKKRCKATIEKVVKRKCHVEKSSFEKATNVSVNAPCQKRVNVESRDVDGGTSNVEPGMGNEGGCNGVDLYSFKSATELLLYLQSREM